MVNTLDVLVPTKDIVETASALGTLTVFLKAVRAADLESALREEGPCTVFAPDDAAFMKMAKRSFQDLMNDRETLRSLVSYHILPGKKILMATVRAARTALTLRGKNVIVDPLHGGMVNNIHVKQADVECANGVIHVIESVLSPEQMFGKPMRIE